VSHNELTTLPDEIGGMKGLRVLCVASNRLVKLPESIGQLHGVEELELGHNK